MHAPAIRPRTAIEIVDAAFSLFRNNFATMAVIGLAASVPFVLFISLGFGAALYSPRQMMDDPMTVIPMIFAIGVVAMLWFAVVDGAMTFAAAEAYHGNRPSPGDAIRGAFSKGLSLVGGNILRMFILLAAAVIFGFVIAVAIPSRNALVAFLGFIVAFVLGAHLLARTFAITSAIVIERRTAMEGVSRSFALSKDSTLRIIGVGLLCLIIYWVAQVAGMMLVQGVVSFILRSPVVAAVLGNVVAMLMYPFLNIALMVLYFDQRVRKEGYDLDVLSSTMTPAPQA